jgi:hypothetical protein
MHFDLDLFSYEARGPVDEIPDWMALVEEGLDEHRTVLSYLESP